jgi:CubicO group peptidase (beta-lactamase class C family)
VASTFDTAREILERAVNERAFPAASVEVGTPSQTLWRQAFGRLTFDPGATATADATIFDLASLTKVLSTTALVMRQIERGIIALDDPVVRYLTEWRDDQGDPVTIRDLLTHCSGLPAHAPLFLQHSGRAAYEQAICQMPRAYVARSKSVYSDLGFMLLGFILEATGTLDAQFDALRLQMGGIQELQFNPPAAWKSRTAPTRVDPWRNRLLIGEVDDDNAWALGGSAGHAGLFGTAEAVGQCARHVLQVLDGRAGAFREDTLNTFITRRTDVPGSSRALGWDTMLPTSSCGARMSPRAFGHTGFTGTTLWIDPDKAVYVVLLTNRVHPTPDNNAIARVRPAVHDAIMDAL